jgi:hypothetical protein
MWGCVHYLIAINKCQIFYATVYIVLNWKAFESCFDHLLYWYSNVANYNSVRDWNHYEFFPSTRLAITRR